MYQIQNLTRDPRQKQTLQFPDGTFVTIEIYFVPMQLGWFITSLVYGSFTLAGVRISNSPNILNQYRNQVPFGLACFSANNREPTLQDDFISENSKLFILTQEECNQYTELLSGQI